MDEKGTGESRPKSGSPTVPRAVEGEEAEELVYLQREPVEKAKGTQVGSRGWLHAPAMLELLSLADKRLNKVSELRGKKVDRVKYVQAALVKGKGIAYIWSCEEGDPDSVEVTRSNSRVTINLWNLLAPADLDLPTGYRALYDVARIKHAALGHTLRIDLGLPIERRNEPERKAKAKSGTENAQATQPEKKAENG